MRRLLASRISTAAVGVAATVVILAGMVGVASGVFSDQAGPPTQVFMQRTDGEADEVCLFATPENQVAMHQDLHLDAGSSVVALFSFEFNRLDVREQAHVGIVLSGGGDLDPHRFKSGVWRFPGSANFEHASGTVTWSFADVPTTGDYTLAVPAWIGAPENFLGRPAAGMDSCSLTVFVSPPVQ